MRRVNLYEAESLCSMDMAQGYCKGAISDVGQGESLALVFFLCVFFL
jgi:hypothetical protein